MRNKQSEQKLIRVLHTNLTTLSHQLDFPENTSVYFNGIFVIYYIKRYWAPFVWYCYICYVYIFFFGFLSQVDWISEKANIIIAVMDENNGVYLMLQIRLFDVSKVKFLERRRMKTEASREEQKRNIKYERPLFT